jgi:hypothetical protein
MRAACFLKDRLSWIAVVIALLAGNSSAPTARADVVQPPPPSLSEERLEIPRPIRSAYRRFVHPSYLEWLEGSDNSADSLEMFMLYLTTVPTSDFERWCFVQLYIATH